MLFAHQIRLLGQTLLWDIHPFMEGTSMNTTESKMVTFGQNLSLYCFFAKWLLREKKENLYIFLFPLNPFSQPFTASFFRLVPFLVFALGLSHEVHHSWFWCCTFVQHLPQLLVNPSWSFQCRGLQIWSRTSVKGSPLNCENFDWPHKHWNAPSLLPFLWRLQGLHSQVRFSFSKMKIKISNPPQNSYRPVELQIFSAMAFFWLGLKVWTAWWGLWISFH